MPLAGVSRIPALSVSPATYAVVLDWDRTFTLQPAAEVISSYADSMTRAGPLTNLFAPGELAPLLPATDAESGAQRRAAVERLCFELRRLAGASPPHPNFDKSAQLDATGDRRISVCATSFEPRKSSIAHGSLPEN